jgi:mannose-6-phosphate isomerase-like protein (cupin superfamily)
MPGKTRSTSSWKAPGYSLEGRELPMTAGDVLAAPEGVPHGVRNTGASRLLVMAILAPAPNH